MQEIHSFSANLIMHRNGVVLLGGEYRARFGDLVLLPISVVVILDQLIILYLFMRISFLSHFQVYRPCLPNVVAFRCFNPVNDVICSQGVGLPPTYGDILQCR